MSGKAVIDIVGLGNGAGCGCGGPVAAADGPSEPDQVLELNAKLRTAIGQVEVRYFDYRAEFPPKELEEVIEQRGLELPVVFVNGKPTFQGRLPTAEDLLAEIQGKEQTKSLESRL